MEREEQSVGTTDLEKESRDVVPPLPLGSNVKTSPQQGSEIGSQKVAPPKPKRPARGWESPLLNRSEAGEEPTNCEQRVSIQPPAVAAHSCHTVKETPKPEPPRRRDSFHRTREQMEKFQNDAVEYEPTREQSNSGNKLPPPPPRRDDSLSMTPFSSGGNEVLDPVIREPPPTPVRVDSVKEHKPETVLTELSPVPHTVAETHKKEPTVSAAPKPTVKPKPPPIARKPGSTKPSTQKPGTKQAPAVAAKPGVHAEELEPVSSQNAVRARSPIAQERLSPELAATKPSPPVVATKPSPPAVATKPSPPAVATKPSPPAVATKPSSTTVSTKPSPLAAVPEPTAVHQPTLAEILADSQDLMPSDLGSANPSPVSVSKPPGRRPPTLVEVLADSHDLLPNDLEGDLSLEEAIKTALRSPTVQKRHMSPATEFPQAAKHEPPPDEFLYEPDNSDKLMDDIDNMLRDLNKELDDLIPGM